MLAAHDPGYAGEMADRWPDLGVLELLVTVAELGSMGAAAQRLDITQPSASRLLARFERRCGLTLLERTPRGSRLTPQGALIVDWARDVLEAAERLTLSTAALRSEQTSELTVAASMTVAEYLVPMWLASFRGTYPEVGVKLSVDNSEHVLEAIAEGSADLGFVETSVVPAGLQTRVVGRDHIVVVVPPGHLWSRRRRPLTLTELATVPLVLRERGSGTRQALVDALERADLEMAPPAQNLTSNAAVRISAISGAGPAVLSEYAVRDSVASGALVVVPVADTDLGRDLRAVWTGGRQPLGPAGGLVTIAARPPTP